MNHVEKLIIFTDSIQDKMPLLNIDARLVTEANAKATNMDMSDVPEVPESDEAVIQVIDHKEKTIRLISCKSEAEAETLISAFKAGKIWSRYLFFCQKSQTQPNKKFLDWLADNVNVNPGEFMPLTIEGVEVFGEEYADEITESVMEFLKMNTLVRNLILKNFDSDELESRIIFQILTTVTGYQIKELSIIFSNVDIESLKILNPGLAHHSHLMYLNLSHNNINDNGLSELAGIFPNITALNDIDLSYNILQGKPEKIEEFLTAAQLNLEDLKVNLSHNVIEDHCINILEISVFHAEDIRITHLDLSFNRFTNEGVYQLFEGYNQGKNKGKFKLVIHPIPFHENFLLPFFQEKKTNMNLTLKRIRFSEQEKKPPSSKQWLLEIKKIVRNIRTVRGQSLTIERLATICHEISELEYEFPNKKLDELRDIVWDLINRAIEIEDFYSITILQSCADKIGLDLFPLMNSLRTLKNKSRGIAKRIVRIINFDVAEADLNRELDEVVIDILKHDMRGTLVDTLFSIKEKRDEFIKKMIESNYKEEMEDEDGVIESRNDPFWFLESGLEYSKINNTSHSDDLSPFEENLYIHPKNLNYFELCKLAQEKLEKNLNLYREKIGTKEPNYYTLNICNRSLFLLADHVFKFYLNVWKFTRGDLLLNCSRLVIQYFNFGKRREMAVLLDPRPEKPSSLTYFKQNYETPDNLYSFQIDFEMGKYIHLKPLEIEKRKSESLTKNLTNPIEVGGPARQHRGGLALADFNPATVKAGGILNELANEKQGPKDKEKLGFQKTILDYTPGGLPSSLRKAKNSNFNQDAIALYQKIQLILDYDAETQEENCMKLIQELFQMLANSRSTYDLDHEPDALIDECYLQLFRYCNRNKEARIAFNQKLVFKLLSILSLYAPPSADLQDHIRAWMFSKTSDLALESYIRKTLMNLMNQDNPEFIKPNWTPSMLEIKERLKNEKDIQISFRFCDESIGTLIIHDFETIEEVMNKLYDSNYLKSYEDKYAFWLYKSRNSKEEDSALFNNEILLEVLSFCDENNCFLLLQRRMICSAFTLNYMKLDQNHLDSFFNQVKRNHILKDKYSDFCKTDTIARIAAILFLIERGLKNKKPVAKSEKIQKKLKSLVPDAWMSKLTSSQLLQKIIPYLQQSNLISMDVWSLKQEFLNNLKSFYLLSGICYECQIQDSVSGKNARVDMSINMNVFGIFFYKTKDKPLRTIFYEEIVYMVGVENECSLFYIEKGNYTETRLNIFCKTNRARELNEDLVSYCILRTKEKMRLLYALSFLPEFKGKFTGKAASVKVKKKAEEEEEEEEELFEEKKKTNDIEQEISNNEPIFLIDKCFAFHYEFPYYFGVQPPEIRNPIPRSKKTYIEKKIVAQKDTDFVSKDEANSIIQGLRKPKALNNGEDDGDQNKEVKSILKKPGEETGIREKKKTIIKEKEDSELDPPPKLISGSSNSSNNSLTPSSNTTPEKNLSNEGSSSPPKSLSLATLARMKMAFKPPPPPPRKPAQNPVEEPKTEEKKPEKGDLSSSNSEDDYSDDIKMKPKIKEIKPIPINKINPAIKLPPPPPRKAPIEENKAKPQSDKKEIPVNENSKDEKKIETNNEKEKVSNENFTKPTPININENSVVSKKELDFPAKNEEVMISSKNDPAKRITPKAHDLKKLDLKAILKPPIIKKLESTKKASIALEKDSEKDKLEKEKEQEKERIEKERIEKERIEKERIEKDRIEKERIEKDRIEKDRIEKDRVEKERIEKERIEKERIEKERIEKERIEKENSSLKKEENPSLAPEEKKPALPQMKLNLSLANALKNFPKAPMKPKKSQMTEEEKFFQLDNDDDKSPKHPSKAQEKKKSVLPVPDNKTSTLEISGKKKSIIPDKKKSFMMQAAEQIKNITNNEVSTENKGSDKKNSVSEINKINIATNEKKEEEDKNQKQMESSMLGSMTASGSPKFERKAIRKKTQKSTSSENSTDKDKEKNLPDFIKNSDDTSDQKESSPKNKQPQSLSDKLKMRANKFKKR